MKETFLEQILRKTRTRVESAKRSLDVPKVRSQAERIRSRASHHRFCTALARTDRTNIIAEIKRASPSKGVINSGIDVRSMARSYESGGAAAISVLTEGEFFGGSLDDLTMVAETVDLPVLRKDFIIDEFQIYEAAAAGAAAVLLIVAALSTRELGQLLKVAETDLGMDALVEVHTADELQVARDAGSRIIGVNNRDLRSLEVSLDVSRCLIANRPEEAIMVAESGITGRDDIEELSRLGFDAFLIGETLMRSENVAMQLQGLTAKREAV